MKQNIRSFWGLSASDLLRGLETNPSGLSRQEAEERLTVDGANCLKPPKRSDALTLLLSQFKSPIILILLFATGLSFFLHDPVDALIILTIVLVSGFIGFWQERGAADAVAKLLAMVHVRSKALRDGHLQDVPMETVVPGDIAVLSAGDMVPGDGVVLDARDLFLDEATLTGETYPVEKTPGVLAEGTPLAQRTNALWMGTHVVSGEARMLVVRTGKDTEFGRVSERLKLRPQETEFEHGVRRFGYFLMEVTLILVLIIFVINVYLKRPVMDSFLFSLALAVGLTPQLLPAIISINLAQGAKRMARVKVIIKRLAAIENFGSMNILCSDKTGTLTEGTVHLQSAMDLQGQSSDKTFLYAYLNAKYEMGFFNPIDEAIRSCRQVDISEYQKLDEIPYDFIRKRLSILVATGTSHLMITKGALKNVLDACSRAETEEGTVVDLSTVRKRIDERFEETSSQGFRTLGVAYREMGDESRIGPEHETELIFLGFLTFFDPPKGEVIQTIHQLRQQGVILKVITGDNHMVAAHLAREIGWKVPEILVGTDLRNLSDPALVRKAGEVDIFCEVEPNQKERIIMALRKAGNVVGYMGDGINDASALHAADVSISVEGAADVAKEAADIVLLEKDLGVLEQGVREGRTTFANTLKYVFMATSANFGNMFSMAGASLFLPFLPLLPKQILLTNLMTDFPEMTIANDAVDTEMVEQPRRWDIGFIRKFMITFGLLSSIFDYLTFGVLRYVLQATTDQFRTGWFLESVVSAALIVLVIRSRKPFFRSRPGRSLFLATILVVILTLILPFTPLAGLFAFRPLPFSFVIYLGLIVILYVTGAEIAKKIFYGKSGS
jgi:Mg2+-importing ATPase